MAKCEDCNDPFPEHWANQGASKCVHCASNQLRHASVLTTKKVYMPGMPEADEDGFLTVTTAVIQ